MKYHKDLPFPIIDKIHGYIATAFVCLGSVGLITLLLSEMTGVIWNYFFNSPIVGIQDISSLSLVVVVCSSMYYCGSQYAHIRVNLISKNLPETLISTLNISAQTISAIISFIASYALFMNGRCGLECGANTDNLYISHAPFYMLMALMMALYGSHFFTLSVQNIIYYFSSPAKERL